MRPAVVVRVRPASDGTDAFAAVVEVCPWQAVLACGALVALAIIGVLARSMRCRFTVRGVRANRTRSAERRLVALAVVTPPAVICGGRGTVAAAANDRRVDGFATQVNRARAPVFAAVDCIASCWAVGYLVALAVGRERAERVCPVRVACLRAVPLVSQRQARVRLVAVPVPGGRAQRRVVAVQRCRRGGGSSSATELFALSPAKSTVAVSMQG